MIRLSPTQSNRVDFPTLYDRVSISGPKFSFKLTETNTMIDYTFEAPDFSSSPMFYNSFTISVGIGSATAGYFNGGIGEYHYYVYEKDNSGITGSLLKEGLMYVSGTISNVTGSTYSDGQTMYVYTGNL